MNTNIVALHTIVSALEKNDYITNVSPIRKGGEEIGYTISFAYGDTITIYHGTDGKDGYTPQIGVVKDTDGIYYWTVDGEWLLDGKGDKIQANGSNGIDGVNGTNGVDGVTPRLKIENDYWYISYDNGATWTELGKATGEDGTDGINGTDGDSILGDIFTNVTQDDDCVYFYLADGSIITLTKHDTKNIQFEDPAVKAICVANWDTNGDGELSYDEAAAVDDIGGLFSNFEVVKGVPLSLGNSNILSFNEFRFFTGVTTLSGKAFCYNTNLYSIILPESLIKIESGGSESIHTGNYSSSSWGYGAFSYTKISYIDIPDGVAEIGSRAFRNCKNLKYISIGNNVEKIGGYAFYNCSNLEYISIGNNVNSIEGSAFSNCTGELHINNRTFVEENYTLSNYPTYDTSSWLSGNIFAKLTIGDNVTKIGDYTFYGCSSLKSVSMSNNITSIGAYAFGKCSSLEEVDIPNGVYSIGDNAFGGCSSLTNISIPSSVTTISSYCFENCSALINIDIPNGVYSVGCNAFSGCSELECVTFGENVASIGSDVFYYCHKLNSIYCKASVPPVVSKYFINYSSPMIYVPKESVAAYRAAEGWKNYASYIVGYDFE